MQKKLSIAILWHMHQPLYKSNDDNIYLMPWVRLHAVKDYLDMLKIMDNFPKLKLNFNLVPVLLDALIDYENENCHDIHSKLTVTPIEDLNYDDKIFILNHFFDANYQNMILNHKYYSELYEKRISKDEINIDDFTDQEYSDIMTWFNLSWTDPYWINIFPELKYLFDKERNFTFEDRKLLISIHRKIIKNIIPEYKKYQDQNRIEISTSPYYHPIIPLLLDMNIAKKSATRYPLPQGKFDMYEDGYTQTVMALDRLEGLFGKRPKGIWPSEHCISEKTAECFAKAGVKWSLSDEGILSSSLKKEFIRDHRGCILDPYDLTQIYEYNTTSGSINFVFRNAVIPNFISFEYPLHDLQTSLNDIQERIKILQNKIETSPSENHLLLIAMDGENSWEGFEKDGADFLNGLYKIINDDDSLESVLLSDYIENNDKKTLKKIYPGSWINRNFQIWVAEPTKNLAWEYLNKTRNDLVEFQKDTSIPKEKLLQAWKEIYIDEGSDWFWWYGEPNDSGQDHIFDYLFREHLINVYKILEKPYPDYLNIPLISFIGKPSKVPKKLISPQIDGKNNLLDGWTDAGYIEIPSRPIMEDKKIINKIFFGFDKKNIYFRFDLNTYIKDENDYFKDFYQIFIYFKNQSNKNKNLSSIRTVNRSDTLFPIIKDKYSNEIKISFTGKKGLAPQLSYATKDNLWVYKLSNNIKFAYNEIAELSISFDELGVKIGEKVDFFILTSVNDITEEVFPQDVVLSIERL